MEYFKEDLEFGKLGEQLFKSKVLPIINKGQITELTNKSDQHFKGDFKVGDEFYEIKTRKPEMSGFNDIIIELSHLGNKTWEGWVNKYDKNTWLIYQRTKKINELELIYPIFMFKPFKLREHVSWLNKYKVKSSQNEEYKTYFVTIPIEKLSKKIDFYSILEGKLIKWKKEL